MKKWSDIPDNGYLQDLSASLYKTALALKNKNTTSVSESQQLANIVLVEQRKTEKYNLAVL